MSDHGAALTIGRGIRCAAARGRDRVAIVAGDRALSYGALVSRMAKVANYAMALGLQPGDRAALIAPNHLNYVEIVAGLSDVGIIVATLNPRLTRAEMSEIIADCAPRLAIVDPSAAETIDTARFPDMTVLTLGDDYEAMLERASDRAPDVAVGETAAFALAYTSGTTGRPKGVLLPHRSRALTFLAMAAEYGCFGQDDNFLAMAPMCHGAGFVFACATLFFGGATTLFPAGDPLAMLDRIGRGDISGMFLVPTQFARLFDQPAAALARRRTHRLRAIISNASALPQAMKERAIDHFGEGLLHESYGSTEGGIVTNIRPRDLLRKPGSVGLPFPGVEIALRTDSGGIAAAGEPGELFCRSPASFRGYWQRPGDTAEAMIDGWVTVGDVAIADDDGYISIVDRKKDMVVTGGLNVYPREVENVIAAMPGVADVAVIGRPSAEWGEALHAFVVPASGAHLDLPRLIQACRDHLAGFKVPRTASLLPEIPRNAGGKILKTVLRDQAP